MITNDEITLNIDIEHYLNTYSNDLPELIVGACWWADSLQKLNQSIPKDNIKKFRKELIIGLRDRIKGHWYPESPERGQGYRAVVCEESTDKLLMDAAKKSDINGNFRQFFKQNTTMWIDPGNVTYRHGKHYEKTLYPFGNILSNSNINTSGNSSYSINNVNNSNTSTTGSNILNNSFLMTMLNSTTGAAGMNGSNGMIPSISGVLNSNPFSSTSTTPNSSTGSSGSTKSLLNSNSINYNPIYFNPQNSTPPRSNSTINGNGNGNPSPTNTIKNSPSLSSSAPAFSPSSSVYHSLLSQHQISQQTTNNITTNNITPPTSPLKDFTQSKLISDSNNTTNLNNSSVYSQNNSRPQTIKQNYL